MSKANIIDVAAQSTWLSGVKTQTQIRDFAPVIMDEPIALGGTDTGANPMEYVVAALNGCKGVMIPLIAKELNFQFSQLSFESKGSIDLRGLLGVEGVSPHFQTFNFDIHIQTNETDARLEQLKTKVASRCPVYNLLQDAGVQVVTTWHKLPEAHSA